MTDVHALIESRLRAALVAAVGEAHQDADLMIRPAGNPKFGDYQANLAMGLGKKLGQKPRDLADQILSKLDPEGVFAKVEVAGPGFINLTLDSALLTQAAKGLLGDERLGMSTSESRTVVVDYASPNLAKEMHIGHLRSTIIGDAIARVLEFQGQRVIRQNHLGDWGTQFGMLLEHLIDTGWEKSDDQHIGDLNALYQQAKQRDDSDPGFAERARQRVVALQGGDEQSLQLWRMLIGESVRHMNDIFGRLNVGLTDGDLKGESFYNDRLGPTVEALRDAGVATESDGALCVFADGDEDAPLIVRKSDGGFGYAATDLAALRHRIGDLGAARLIYVVDSRQRTHFSKFFAAARKAGWAGEAQLDYVPFGTIMGKDNKPFKTREGGTVKLSDVLNDAIERADAVIAEKNADMPAEQRKAVAKAVGIGAVKYADLSSDRIKDYIFDWDRMLSLEGNTAPYLQYSYARIQSIFRKGEVDKATLAGAAVNVSEPAEKALLLKLLQWPATVNSVADSLEPHRLCNWLFELATAYHQFYERCPVLKAEAQAVQQSRLALCLLVSRALKLGLELLGIEVVEQM